ncbi:MAG: hypothetical protein HY072_01490 [Deltaproteobacteria bacterium]|nr:hypothetical protein [Deltaproteobacteria bacterium]
MKHTKLFKKQNLFLVFILLIVPSLLFQTGCGTTVGNPVTSDITISSDAFSLAGLGAIFMTAEKQEFITSPEVYFATSVTEFKFCVKRIKLEDEDGNAKKKDGETGDDGEKDPEDIRFSPGLIDLSAGIVQDWGTVNIPIGFKLKKIKIKVKQDKTLCGVNYSVKFNTQEANEDIEFKWKFNPALDLTNAVSALKLSFSTIISTLKAAADAGTLSKIKSHILI